MREFAGHQRGAVHALERERCAALVEHREGHMRGALGGGVFRRGDQLLRLGQSQRLLVGKLREPSRQIAATAPNAISSKAIIVFMFSSLW